MAKQHRRFEATDKVKIIREHLLEHQPLSEVCKKHGIAPTQFYQWQKTFFENGQAAFEATKPSREYEFEDKIVCRQQEWHKRNSFLRELFRLNDAHSPQLNLVCFSYISPLLIQK